MSRPSMQKKPVKHLLSYLFLICCVESIADPAETTVASGLKKTGNDGWVVDEKLLPLPAGASAELQQAIAVSPRPLVKELGEEPPQSENEWLVMQRESSKASLDEIAEAMNVSISRDKIAGVPVYRVNPKTPASKHDSKLFLHFHAGGYVLTGGDAAPAEAALIAGAIGIEAISVDYRMSPLHPFPAALEDAVAVYRQLLENHSAESIVVGGSSAGGGLTLATVLQLKALELALPGAIWVGTPWADLSKTGDSLYTNDGIDRVVMTYDGVMAAMARLYASGENLKHPLISPVYGEYRGFPPTQLVTGTRDLFLSDTVRTHRKMRASGVDADLNVYEGFSHAEYLMVPDSAESREVLRELDRFIENFAAH